LTGQSSNPRRQRIRPRHGDYWMPAFAGMTAEFVDARHKAGHDEFLCSGF
jgi:hypothetical protein